LVLQLRKQLATAVAGNHVEQIKQILRRMKTEIHASEDLLRETKVGLSVGKLRQNGSKEVAEMAKEIVRKWKNNVAPTSSGVKNDARGSASQSPAPSGSQSISASPAPDSKPIISSDIKSSPSTINSNGSKSNKATRKDSSGGMITGPRSAETDAVDFNEYSDPTRDKCMQLVYDALVQDSAAPSDLIYKRAKDIEAGTLDAYPDEKNPGQPGKAYRDRIRTLCFNLKKNAVLSGNVVSGDESVAKLVKMSAQEMATSQLKEERIKLHSQNLFEARGAAAQVAETDMFKCGRCRQRKCTYYQMQTRSADEPMTTFVTCVNCNNRWKFS